MINNVNSSIDNYSDYHKPMSTEKDRQATKIQKIFRGHSARKLKESVSLPKSYRSYNSIISNNEYCSMPTNQFGDTRVYFPENDKTVVLKHSGSQKRGTKSTAYERLCLMNHARTICRAEQFKSLVIPKAIISNDGNFLFEERLPFNINEIEQERLSATYSQDPVFRDFARFVLITGMWDIVWNKLYIDRYPKIRFDNFPLYLSREGKLYMGLIDLERINTTTNKMDFSLLPTLVYAFPHSFDLIMDEARRCGLTDEIVHEIEKGLADKTIPLYFLGETLEKVRQSGLKRNKMIFGDLVTYMAQKKNDHTIQSLSANKEEQKELVQELTQEPSIPNKEKSNLTDLVDQVCNALIKIMEMNKNNNHSSLKEQTVTFNSSYLMLSLRSDLKYCDLEVEKVLQKLAEKKYIYSFHGRGFITTIVY